VFYLASTHLGRDTQQQIYWSVDGPRGSETPTVGAPGRGSLRVKEHFPVEFYMGSLQEPLQPGTVLRFGSLEFMSLDGSYDMVLLPPQRDSNDSRRLTRQRRTRRWLPTVAEEEHPGLPRHPPRWRRRRRGNRGRAGGGTSSAVGLERVNDAGTPAGAMSGVVLAPETTTGVASLQRANPERTDDASTLAKDLLDVSLVPEITVQSVPDATSPPSIDQKVPSVFHPVPFRFSFDPPSDPTSVSAFARAYPDLLGHHMWSSWDQMTAVSTSGPAGSEEDDNSDFGWDFSGLSNPSAMRDFMSACEYCLSDCSDNGHSLGDEGCDPSRECFHIDQGGHGKDNHLGMPQDDNAPVPVSRVDIPRELAVVPVPAGGQDTQLEQFREMQAKLDEEAGRLVQLRQNIEQEWAGRALAGGARHRARDVQRCIIDEARAGLPPAFSGVGQNLAVAAMLLRAMLEPSTTEGRRIQGELKGLLEDAAVRQAESSASRSQGCPSEHHATSSQHVREASVRTGRTRDGTPAAPDRLGDEQHRHDHRACLEEKVRRGYHPRRGGRYDSEEDRSPSPELLGLRVFSRAIRRAPFLARFRAPTTITNYSGETRPKLWLADYRLACQLGGTNDDNLIIRNLPFSSPTLPSMAGASASRADLRLGRPGQGLRGKLPRYVRAPRELMGPPKLSPAARGIHARVHPTVFKAAHRAAQHHRLGRHRGIPRRHHVAGPGEQTGAQDSHQGERIDGHRHQVRLWSGGSRSHLPEGQEASGKTEGRRPRGIRPAWPEKECQEEGASKA
jgi:hypothetical protein